MRITSISRGDTWPSPSASGFIAPMSSSALFFFVAVVQARRSNGEMVAFRCTFSTVVVSWIAFFVPIELDSFAVLRSAQPRAAKLPFFAFRFIEMFVFCLVFWVKWEDAQCTGAVNLHSHDRRFTDYAAGVDPGRQCCKEGCCPLPLQVLFCVSAEMCHCTISPLQALPKLLTVLCSSGLPHRGI